VTERPPRPLPTYEEEERRPQTAEEFRAAYSWATEAEAARGAEQAAAFRRVLARTAGEVGPAPQRPDAEQREWLFPEKPGEVGGGLPLFTREARDGFLVVLLKWFGLKRVVRLVPRERWDEALAAVYGPPLGGRETA
jgi:hypothetical protein